MAKINNGEKSVSKPLLDISNGVCGLKHKSNRPSTKKISAPNDDEIVVKIEQQVEEEDDDKILDVLVLTHSELSKVIEQIDELVVQAHKSRKGRKEVESFTHVLSDIHSSLKAWVPRFQNALSSPSVADNQIGESSPREATRKESNDVSQCPEEIGSDSLVSPTPLVPWHAEHTVSQLFLITPSPSPISKALPSVRCGSSTFTAPVERFTAPPKTTLGLPSSRTISADTSDDLLEGVYVKPTRKKVLGSFNEKESAAGSGFISTRKTYNRNKSPPLNLSPPKSCVLLEPISESFHHNFNNNRKLTPFPGPPKISSPSGTSELSRSFTSESLALKYPELFGIKLTTCKSGAWRKQVDAMENLLMSPPKSCVLLEPSSEGTGGVDLFNSGPVLNERIYCRDENTLKQELWARFEAAS